MDLLTQFFYFQNKKNIWKLVSCYSYSQPNEAPLPPPRWFLPFWMLWNVNYSVCVCVNMIEWSGKDSFHVWPQWEEKDNKWKWYVCVVLCLCVYTCGVVSVYICVVSLCIYMWCCLCVYTCGVVSLCIYMWCCVSVYIHVVLCLCIYMWCCVYVYIHVGMWRQIESKRAISDLLLFGLHPLDPECP